MTMRASCAWAGTFLAALVGCGGGSGELMVEVVPPVTAVAVGDFNRDGREDAAFLVGTFVGRSDPGTLVLRFATGDPQHPFQAPVRLAVGTDPRQLVAADLNGDGALDLVVVDGSMVQGTYGVTCLLNAPSQPGTFQPALRVGTGGRSPLQAAVGDLNGDGRPDLAIAALGGASALVAFQRPDGTFLAPQEVALDGEPRALAIGPVHRSAPEQELFVATTAGTVNVLLQSPTDPGGFQPRRVFPGAPDPTGMVLGDFNANGYTDVAVADGGTGQPGSPGSLRLLQQNVMILGSCIRCVAFDPPVTLPAGGGVTRAVAASDLDGDGRLDLIACNAGVPGDPGSLSLWFPVPSQPGTFYSPDRYQGYWGPQAVAIGDLDGDGLPDLLLADGEARVRFQDRNAPGWFFPPVTLLR